MPANLNDPDSREPTNRAAAGVLAAAVLLLAAAALVLAALAIVRTQLQVVNYTVVPSVHGPRLLSGAFLLLLLAAPVAAACWASAAAPGHRLTVLAWGVSPLLLTAPLALYGLAGLRPPFVLTFLPVVVAGVSGFVSGLHLRSRADDRGTGRAAISLLCVLIVVLTLLHVRDQINFYEHFMLGHADIGHYAEEFKNVLAGRGLRSDSFDNTRLGWHFSPILFALVPGYALFPTPVYLMVVGALAVHVTALPIYWFALRRGASAWEAFLFAAGWLALPSVSRMIYGGTYGFTEVLLAVPLLTMMTACGCLGRWRWCWVFFVLALLVKETVAAATFGWGIYLALFSKRRATGVAMALVSVVWIVACTEWVIPYFAVSGRFERAEMFGELGSTLGQVALSLFRTPDLFWARVARPEGALFLVMLAAPMALLPLVGWRLSVAAVPTLGLLLLLENTDWLSIKFWHPATVLPFLFLAGIEWATRDGGQAHGCQGRLATASAGGGARMTCAAALACALAAGWAHYLYGFSPVTRSYDEYAASAVMQQPDPRIEVVQYLRQRIPKSASIQATERLAAHFTDYRRIYTGARSREADFVIIEQGDGWDTSGLPQAVESYEADPGYRRAGQWGRIVLFERVSNRK